MNMINFVNMWKDKIAKWPRGQKVVWLVVGVFIILWIVPTLTRNFTGRNNQETGSAERRIKYWTCSMHPQIKLPKPGQCPICAMDLIPVYEDDAGSDNSGVSLSLSAAARQLAEVQTEAVQYQPVFHEVRLVGKVEYDETKLSYISAWVPGRIDRLFVDFTGTQVRKGDHLIKLYSPELISAQEEYIQAIKNWNDTQNSSLSVMRDTAASTLKSSREKLRLFGISNDQIKDIEERKTIQEHLTVNSPVTGTVIQKNGFEGQYVQTGDRIYSIADLSQVWIYLQAYESDIQWLHYGQHVQVEAEAYPGETFSGKIAFIDPFVDEKTRTINLRVNVNNENNRLKPGMFVRTVIRAELGEGGKIYEKGLAGKWICPMHPEIIKDQSGICDICEMNLIPTKEFGFAEQPLKSNKALTIPASAPLITGKRAVVYVEKSAGEGRRVYEGREVVLGPRAKDQYVVFSGLQEGERVVIKGNFKIDSALQIQAQPSMMNPSGYYSEREGKFSPLAVTPSVSMDVLLMPMQDYLEAVKLLAHDSPHEAARELGEFRDKLAELIKQNQSNEDAAKLMVDIQSILQKMDDIPHELQPLRVLLSRISEQLRSVFETYEYHETLVVYLMFCPMALEGQGAYWFQDTETVANPYLGTKMLNCGEIKRIFGRRIERKQSAQPGHQH